MPRVEESTRTLVAYVAKRDVQDEARSARELRQSINRHARPTLLLEQFAFECTTVLPWSAGAVLPLSTGEAVLRPQAARNMAGLKRRKHGLRTPKMPFPGICN